MQFGVKLGNNDPLPLEEGVARLAVEAETCEFDSVWVADHIVYPKSHELDTEHVLGSEHAVGQHADSLISLAYVAARTKRVLLGSAVMVLPIRNPLMLAKMLSTLDVFSGGRVVLGAGVGWLESEFAALHAPDFAKRGKISDEWIRILRTCWENTDPSFNGEHYSFPPLHFAPQPARKLPIWIGGNSPAALRRAGTLGDGWLGSRVGFDALPSAMAAIRQSAEAAGRDPAALVMALGVEVQLLNARDKPNALGLFAPDRALVGTAPQLVDRILSLQALGLQHLELRFQPMRDRSNKTVEPTIDMLRQFSEEVMPHCKA